MWPSLLCGAESIEHGTYMIVLHSIQPAQLSSVVATSDGRRDTTGLCLWGILDIRARRDFRTFTPASGGRHIGKNILKSVGPPAKVGNVQVQEIF